MCIAMSSIYLQQEQILGARKGKIEVKSVQNELIL